MYQMCRNYAMPNYALETFLCNANVVSRLDRDILNNFEKTQFQIDIIKYTYPVHVCLKYEANIDMCNRLRSIWLIQRLLRLDSSTVDRT